MRTDTHVLAKRILNRWNHGELLKVQHGDHMMSKIDVESMLRQNTFGLWGEEEADMILYWVDAGKLEDPEPHEDPEALDLAKSTPPDFIIMNPVVDMIE